MLGLNAHSTEQPEKGKPHNYYNKSSLITAGY